MKRWICWLLCFCLMFCSALGEEDAFQDTGVAPELDVAMADGRTELDQSVLRDWDDSTGYTFKRDRASALTAVIPEETPLSALYLRMDCQPASVTLQQKQGKNWVAAAETSQPFNEVVLRLKTPLTGEIRLVLNYEKPVACTLTELRLFGAGKLNERLHNWKQIGQADVLIVCDSLNTLDPALITECTEKGLNPAVCAMVKPDAGFLELSNTLWNAGLRMTPAYGGFAKTEGTAAQILKKWVEKPATAAVTGWIRRTEPLILLTLGEGEADDALEKIALAAVANASDYLYEESSAAAYGLWVTPARARAGDENVGALLDAPAERSYDAIRALCREMWADNTHSDPSEIPYPAERGEDGYLTEGEFVYEDPEKGLWAYLSPTVQVEIVKYEQPSVPRVWFVTELYFKPESEKLQQVVYNKASFKDQQTYPETLAQNANLVLGINGDYYPYRVKRKTNIGNILRNYTVLYDYNPSKSMAYPNLDTMALNDDGTMTVYDKGTVTATELAEKGTVHDALSFGPWLARNGKLRIYDGPQADNNEPRSAIGMLEAGHYMIVTAEGKMPKGGPAGITINQVATMLYGLGVREAFNLDGGSTAVLIFMGTKLNRTGKGSSVGSPRNMHELFGVGTSPSTHTDMLNGK